jgi:hypothetical protein
MYDMTTQYRFIHSFAHSVLQLQIISYAVNVLTKLIGFRIITDCFQLPSCRCAGNQSTRVSSRVAGRLNELLGQHFEITRFRPSGVSTECLSIKPTAR